MSSHPCLTLYPYFIPVQKHGHSCALRARRFRRGQYTATAIIFCDKTGGASLRSGNPQFSFLPRNELMAFFTALNDSATIANHLTWLDGTPAGIFLSRSFDFPRPSFTFKVGVAHILALQSALLMHDLKRSRNYSLVNLLDDLSHAFSCTNHDLGRRGSDLREPFDCFRNCKTTQSVSCSQHESKQLNSHFFRQSSL